MKEYLFSDIIHDHGLYLPNNPDMTVEEIQYIANIVNKSTQR
jgi:dTDP-4-amino-4,6-dideoxygalactose transaminase